MFSIISQVVIIGSKHYRIMKMLSKADQRRDRVSRGPRTFLIYFYLCYMQFFCF